MATDNVAPGGRRDPDGVDNKRRRMLTTGMGVVGAVGAAALAIPLVSSMSPSARARAAGAPVEVDISKLADGQRVIVEWRGKPVWVVKRCRANCETRIQMTPFNRNLRKTNIDPSGLKSW